MLINTTENAEHLISRYIIEHIEKTSKTLFVALQGPQGAGKSYVTAKVYTNLASPPNNLRVAVVSLDDIYLTLDELHALSKSHPENRLWSGRGQLGTHDVELGIEVLSALQEGTKSIELPRFDKSLRGGEGDRLPLDGTGSVIKQPPSVDVVIMEGWCTGFRPISQNEIEKRWNGVWAEEKRKLNLKDNEVCRKSDIHDLNEKLKDYTRLWNYFDIFVCIKPKLTSTLISSEYAIIYSWRLEQERKMKAQNDGQGMADEAVKSFVDRFIPGHVFFEDRPQPNENKIPGCRHSLNLFIDEDRKVVEYATVP